MDVDDLDTDSVAGVELWGRAIGAAAQAPAEEPYSGLAVAGEGALDQGVYDIGQIAIDILAAALVQFDAAGEHTRAGAWTTHSGHYTMMGEGEGEISGIGRGPGVGCPDTVHQLHWLPVGGCHRV